MGKYGKEIFLTAILLWLLAVIAFFVANNHYKKVYKDDLAYSSSLLCYIDDLSTSSEQISGWCLRPGADIDTFDIRVILWSDMLGYGYVIPAQLQDREDVSDYMDDGYDYGKSGFLCCINGKSIQKAAYEVLVQYRCNNDFGVVPTGHYYVSAHDTIYKKPDLSEGLLCDIEEMSVADAVIRGWCLEEGKNSGNQNISIIFWDEKNGYGYQLPAYMEHREDVTGHFDDGTNYDDSGFFCSFDNSWMEPGDYRIYIQCRRGGVEKAADTGENYCYRTKSSTIHDQPKVTGNLIYELEDISQESASISGWCVMPGESIETDIIDLIFWKEDKEYGYAVPASMAERPDITQRFGDGCDYDKGGFVCDYKGRLPLDGKYKVYIQYNGSHKKGIADTGAYIYAGGESNG